mmetsp:Transcript_18896/g.35167  ORF Transcript_18896/g.35167 Transcript_18896/m.35167 type:complete len:200 (+) Transcript_18896:576-1175(+)
MIYVYHMPSERPSAQPSVSVWPTLLKSESPSVSARPSTSSVPSGTPSTTSPPSSRPSSSSPQSSTLTAAPNLHLRYVHLPPNSIVPCRETIEAEIAGQINCLSSAFCGFCTWKATGFNCHQRINYLVAKYQMTQVGARQGLLDQGRCEAPLAGSEELLQVQAQVEIIHAYCKNVDPVVSVSRGRGDGLFEQIMCTTLYC